MIPGGMLYVGTNLTAPAPAYGMIQEPALLNPLLTTAQPGTRLDEQLPYWPRYDQLDPAARAALLSWLATGRQDPDINLGLVFVYFYGLERRIVVDAAKDPIARAEVPALVAEVERLLKIYGDSGSFRRYANQLVLYAHLTYSDTRLYRESVALRPQMEPHDVRVLVSLGQAVLDGQALSPDWALAWYLVSEEVRLRTPARRCWEQFVQLFRARYQDRFPEGLVVAPNKSRLKLPYTPASPGLSSLRISLPTGELPAVTRLSKPLRVIAEIAEGCMDELDAYSRHVGKRPEAHGLQAVALLPAELTDSKDPKIAALRAEFEQRFAGAALFTSQANFLFDHWPIADGNKMTKRECTELMHFLDRLGYGIEPDPRFGGPSLARADTITAFRQDERGKVSSPSSEYASVALVLRLAALVAAADGTVDAAELRSLELHVENAFGLTGSERRRLTAHAHWLALCPPSVAGLKKRLAHLSDAVRRTIADFAVAVANADGRIEPAEVDVLRKLHVLLGLEPDQVFEALNRSQAQSSAVPAGPVVVRPAKRERGGYAIPSEPQPPVSLPLVDMDVVRRKLQETAQVSALLSDIFVDDEGQAEGAASVAPHSPQNALVGIGADQVRFLRALLRQTEWEMGELEALADEHAILLDGTIEAVNELAFEQSGEPAVEWSNPVEVNVKYLMELLE